MADFLLRPFHQAMVLVTSRQIAYKPIFPLNSSKQSKIDLLFWVLFYFLKNVAKFRDVFCSLLKRNLKSYFFHTLHVEGKLIKIKAISIHQPNHAWFCQSRSSFPFHDDQLPEQYKKVRVRIFICDDKSKPFHLLKL